MGSDLHNEVRIIFRGIAPWRDAFLDKFYSELLENEYLSENIEYEKILPVSKRFFVIMTDLIESSNCEEKLEVSLKENIIGHEDRCLCSKHLDEVYGTFVKALRPFAGDLWKDDSEKHWNDFKKTISGVCVELDKTA